MEPVIPRGMKINNPGNLRITKTPWVGKLTPSNDPEFETFWDVEHGIRAAAKIFCIYHLSHKLSTIAQFISRWAPPEDSNPTSAYIEFVARACAVDQNNQFNILDAGNLARMLKAVFRFEQGNDFCTDEQIEIGVREALTSL